jgi:hypothetical protein
MPSAAETSRLIHDKTVMDTPLANQPLKIGLFFLSNIRQSKTFCISTLK